jgi:hypothetical protein
MTQMGDITQTVQAFPVSVKGVLVRPAQCQGNAKRQSPVT